MSHRTATAAFNFQLYPGYDDEVVEEDLDQPEEEDHFDEEDDFDDEEEE